MLLEQLSNSTYRLAIGIAFMAGVLLIWINLAVGIIGEPDDHANLMYVGILAIGVIGAIVGRFQPGAMARTMFAMAGAQVLVASITLLARLGMPPGEPKWVLMGNGLFFALFAGSALLFRRAQTHKIETNPLPQK